MRNRLYFGSHHVGVAASILMLSLSILIIVANPNQPYDTRQDSTDPENIGKTNTKELRASEALESIRNWALRFGRDIYYGTQEASCFRVLYDQFDPGKTDPSRRGPYKASVISNDWTSMHSDIVRTISNTMSWHRSAVEAIAKASESLAKNHTYDENLRFDYVDVHRLIDLNDLTTNNVDQDGNPLAQPGNDNSQPIAIEEYPSTPMPEFPHTETAQLDASGQLLVTESPTSPEQLGTPAPLVFQEDKNISTSGSVQSQDVEWETPIRYLKLQKHPNFGDVPISTEDSAVHVPVHIFPGDPPVMNGIAWSDSLTKVFRDNFIRNPKLTNQYFASQTGFMRLFPAQRWQIPRTDPDLYDSRMRPWYVAGASSRKEVVILVDGSGSMTGSRRDIAKGVVFEILDTLTDNDNFLILKFSDTVQQVGVPTCAKMNLKRRRGANIPMKNWLYHPDDLASLDDKSQSGSSNDQQQNSGKEVNQDSRKKNGSDVDSLYFLPATGRNVRYVKTNFTISTNGIANFSHALATAFEVLLKYQDAKQLGSQCNQAIMLITDGSPSDFEEIFNHYNYPNAPVRVFTYLIGRETGDGTHTKMMACRNRGYYTHVINLAEVRETVQQYVPVMARPLVLNRAHPITWTPAYGELTYQILTDWIWESRRRERARAILAAKGRGASLNQQTYNSGTGSYVPDISITNGDGDQRDQGSTLSDSNGDPGGTLAGSLDGDFNTGLDPLELDALDVFGYQSNPDCFWEANRNDLLTTVVQPVHDLKNDTKVVERYLNKNTWVTREMTVRTANLLGVAAADMKINDIIALAPSHLLGPNAYAVLLTNNGLVMHHPDLRSILEPSFTQTTSVSPFGEPISPASRLDKLDGSSRILKPFFSSMDFTQVEHILQQSNDGDFLKLRKEATEGLTGWRELLTKRTVDCQRRVQSRKQSFYYKSVENSPFSFMIAIPQPYGSHRLEAQIDIKSSTSSLPERLTTYFTTSDFDIWTVHPDYDYCSGPSNNTITTLLDIFQKIQEGKLDDLQARPAESRRPPISLPDKIIYNKELVQSLVYDAVATYGFSESCSLPSSTAE